MGVVIDELFGSNAALLTDFFFLSQGDYDVVINDYEKAKSLFGNTEVAVFKKGVFYIFSALSEGFCPNK